MAPLAWSNTYSVGIQILDDQHAALFDSLSELHAAMLKNREKSITGRLLQDLLAYTQRHFCAEELLLAKAHYPGLAEHRAKHQVLATQVAGYAERFARGEAALSVHLIEFMRRWLISHILRDDRAYSAWLSQAGTR